MNHASFRKLVHQRALVPPGTHSTTTTTQAIARRAVEEEFQTQAKRSGHRRQQRRRKSGDIHADDYSSNDDDDEGDELKPIDQEDKNMHHNRKKQKLHTTTTTNNNNNSDHQNTSTYRDRAKERREGNGADLAENNSHVQEEQQDDEDVDLDDSTLLENSPRARLDHHGNDTADVVSSAAAAVAAAAAAKPLSYSGSFSFAQTREEALHVLATIQPRSVLGRDLVQYLQRDNHVEKTTTHVHHDLNPPTQAGRTLQRISFSFMGSAVDSPHPYPLHDHHHHNNHHGNGNGSSNLQLPPPPIDWARSWLVPTEHMCAHEVPWPTPGTRLDPTLIARISACLQRHFSKQQQEQQLRNANESQTLHDDDNNNHHHHLLADDEEDIFSDVGEFNPDDDEAIEEDEGEMGVVENNKETPLQVSGTGITPRVKGRFAFASSSSLSSIIRPFSNDTGPLLSNDDDSLDLTTDVTTDVTSSNHRLERLSTLADAYGEDMDADFTGRYENEADEKKNKKSRGKKKSGHSDSE